MTFDSIDPYWLSLYDGRRNPDSPRSPSKEFVEPWHFAQPHSVLLGLQADPPDIVIAHDLGAPAYSALRLRQAGIAFENTLFVVFCHGTRRYIANLSPDVPFADLQTVLAISTLEQTSVELADVVVSPSAYLVEWMRGQGWELPERTLVIPYFTRPGATGEPAATMSRPNPDPLRRIAFFGRVDEKKGLKAFAAGLNAVEPERLDGLELEFVGKTTATWTRERAEGLLSDETKRALRRVSFESELDQHEALALLSRPGTLAVMPSLHDNSPNTVYECLEQRHSLHREQRGRRAGADRPGRSRPRPVRANRRGRRSRDQACARTRDACPIRFVPPSTVASRPTAGPRCSGFSRSDGWMSRSTLSRPRVDVVVVRRGSQEALLRCVAALEEQTHANFDVVVADTRQSGLDQGSAPYVVFLDDEDIPDPGLVKTLLAAGAPRGPMSSPAA